MKEHKSHNRHRYKFTDKSQSAGGMLSTVIAAGSIALFAAAVWISYRNEGNGGREIGFLGLLSLFFSAVGLYTGVRSFQEEEIFFLFSWVGTVVNAVMLIAMAMIFLIGL